MNLKLAILLMVSCLFSGVAIGLSYAGAKYTPLLKRQSEIIKHQSLVLDAWKKSANMMSNELRICEEEKE